MTRFTLAAVVVGWLSAVTAQAVNMEMVSVGNPGNAPDTRYANPGYGSVGHDYRIGKYEVTAGQYCGFLNAVARTDTYGLYSMYMDTEFNATGCNIKRTGTSGSYSYNVVSPLDWANRPVNFISWRDAARFANWMHNGQPSGAQDLSTTEDGSYFLNGAMSIEALALVTRKPDATWVIPSEDEWYKAAYHKNDGVTGNYWDYPTGTDTTPGNILANPDPGNNANFNDAGSVPIGAPYYRTEVGAFENSASPYGTFDQGGNVWEFNEEVFDVLYRGLRGGAHYDHVGRLLAADRSYFDHAASHGSAYGFRIAEVPEPAMLMLLALSSLAVIRTRRISR